MTMPGGMRRVPHARLSRLCGLPPSAPWAKRLPRTLSKATSSLLRHVSGPTTGPTNRERSSTTTRSFSKPSGLAPRDRPSARYSMHSVTRKAELMIRIKYIPLSVVLTASIPGLVFAQASPFLTGVTSLQENILEWLTPVAIILVMVLGGMAMANRIAQVSSTYGTGEAQTIVENCGNSLILRCSGSDQGGTANFASRLIGQREVLRTNRSRSRRPGDLLSSTTLSEHVGIEPAVMASQIEQLPDLAGYLKFASVPHWQQ